MGLSSWALPQKELAMRGEHTKPLDKRQEEAIGLIQQAGITSGFGFQLLVPTSNSSPDDLPTPEKLSHLLRNMWNPITAYAQITPMKDQIQFRETLITQQFEVAITPNVFPTYPHPGTLILHWGIDGPRNYTGVADETLNNLLEKQAITLEHETRLDLIHKAQHHILNSFAGIFLPIARPCFRGKGVPVQAWIQGYQPNWQASAMDNLKFHQVRTNK